MSQRGGFGRTTPTAGALLALLRTGGPLTRAELLERCGCSRQLLGQHLDVLLSARLVVERMGRSTGGRPPARVAFDHDGGVVAVAWLGRTRCGAAVTDLAGRLLVAEGVDVSLDAGPDVVLPRIAEAFDQLLARTGRDRSGLRGVGIGVPWPVAPDAAAGVPSQVVAGWHDVHLAAELADRFGVPVVVDKDADLAALAEHRRYWAQQTQDLLYLKVGASIACGIVSGGVVQRGSQGAAGELGHVWVGAAADEPCPCGNRGCLDTVASGLALARRLAAQGRSARDGGDVVRLAQRGDAEAGRFLREAGRAVGEALAVAVNLLNPAVVVVGGGLAAADDLLAGVREGVYQRATANATGALRIVRSALGEPAGLLGPAIAVLDVLFDPDAVDALLGAASTPVPV